MARIRSIKPTFWTDEKIGLLPRTVRLTFLGLISAMADDHGRLVASERIIRGAVYPYDDDISAREVAEHIETLIAAKRIVRYRVSGDDYLYIRHWFRHQRVDKPQKSLLPPPPEHLVEDEAVDDDSQNDSSNDLRPFVPERSGSGAEGIGAEWKGSGADGASDSTDLAADLDPVVREEDRAAPAAPLVELPIEAVQLVEQCYSLGSAKRRLDVTRQLYDTLDPRPVIRGARLRKGVYVKARSSEHLAVCCRAVLADPPRNIDAAIVIVLEKLLDPPPGPTATEKHKASEDRRVQQEDAYQRAAKSAGVAWAKTHPDEYEPIRLAVEHEFKSAGENTFAKMARDSALTQRCAAAAGFPDFENWQSSDHRAAS